MPGLTVPQASPFRVFLANVESGSAVAAMAAPRPSVLFTDVEAGPVTGGPNNVGVPISIFGKGFGAARGTSRVTIGGAEVASYMVWGANNAHNKALDMIVVQPGPNVAGGAIVVTVNGQASNSDRSFTVRAGNIYYIATNGSDSNPCSLASPCATILHVASDVMTPGDTVLVRGGTYAEDEIWIQHEQGGLLGQAKAIKNYPGEEAYLSNAGRDIIVDADYITVSGLTFLNGKSLNAAGWASRDQAGARFINNRFSGTIGWAAIDTEGRDHVIAGNSCEISGSAVGTMGHCYYISQGSNLKILYNLASGTPGYGIHIYDEQRASSDFQRIIRDVLVEGNILKSSTQRSGMIIAMADQGGYGNYIDNITIRNNIFTANNHTGLVVAGASRNLKVYNNTFYQNGRQAIYIDGDATINGVDVRNNLFYQSANSNCSVDCDSFPDAHIQVGAAAQNVTISNNSYHPGSPGVLGGTDVNAVTGAVQFANAATLDFHILAGSAVIDRGLTLGDVPTDYDGITRPQGGGYDVGAFEYTTDGTPSVSVTISPAMVSLSGGESQQFTATVTGTTSTAVTWSMTPVTGTLSAAGLYTAPVVVTSGTTVTVTATSVADPSRSASATVTLVPAQPVSVTISPQTASLSAGQSQQFAAVVSGTTNTSVTWSMNPAMGTLSTSGLYAAPATISAPATVVVTATSVADSAKSASATVSLFSPPVSVSVSVSPVAVSLNAGQSQQFAATVGGTTNRAVTWSLSAAVGTLSTSGLYTAPNSITAQQSVRVTATSVADPTRSSSATVTLNPPAPTVSVSISPVAVSLGQGQNQQFTATASGTSNKAVTWSLSPAIGTVSASGLYTAPSSITTQQSVRITATSVADPTKSASATITLNPPAPTVSVSLSPVAVGLGQGQSQQFAAAVSGARNVAVTWSMSPAAGTLSAAGLYTAPSSITTQQLVRVTATSVADSTKSASANVALNPPARTAYQVRWTQISATQVKVSWTAPTGRTASDRIALSGYGSPDWWYVWERQTGGAASGSFVVVMPTQPGVWQFRYYLSKYTIAARSADMPVGVSQFSVTALPAATAPNASLTVLWTAPNGRPASAGDVIGLYKPGAPNGEPVWYQDTRGAATGTLTLSAPRRAGIYEFRYVMDYLMGARSAPVTVK